jgi:hypothetical protein
MQFKILRVLFFAGFLFTCNFLSAQAYTVTYSNAPYDSLTGATLVDESNPDDISGFDVYQSVPIGFTFDFQGYSFDSIRMAEDGNVRFFEGSLQRTYISMFDCDLENFQDDAQQSPILYKVEGTPGNRIFKCEYVKVGFQEDADDDDFVSFQLWIYEDCNDFEVRIGTINIDPLELDLYWNGNQFAAIGYGLYFPYTYYLLSGSPTAPVLQTNLFTTMNAATPYGTVYNFTICGVGINEVEAPEFQFYPNPTSDIIQIESERLHDIDEIRIVDVNGRIVLSKTVQGPSQMVMDVGNLETGLYLVQGLSSQFVVTKKLVKY